MGRLLSTAVLITEHRAPLEFWGSEKWRSLIYAYRSLAITTNTPGFKELSTALIRVRIHVLPMNNSGFKTREY